MSFETVARQTSYRQVRARSSDLSDLRSLADRKLLGRIWQFAQRHHRRLGAFVAVSVVGALLAIARLLLGSSRVVVLDEATASLDSGSDAAVQQALAEALSGRTSIVIAHRLSTVRAADMIRYVEYGGIVERGTHDQLMASGGRYAELYDTEFGNQPDPENVAEDVVAA